VVEAAGKRIGFIQRTSVYWPTDHEAGERSAGVAALRGITAYQVPLHKTRPEIPPVNRPGVPPIVVTWADRDYLARHRADLEELRKRADIVVASQHWGLGEEVLEYMTEIAHSAIDAGADVVIGTARTTRCRLKSTRASRSSTAWAASPSTPATAGASTETGSACWRASRSMAAS
jgi:poly-gamma-glutamate synthesis protein (capsule biosynthesis protein)